MELMKNKVGLVMGIANKNSIATHIAKFLEEQGAEIAVSYQPMGGDEDKYLARIKKGSGLSPEASFYPCNVANDEDIEALFEKLKSQYGKIDFIVHSIAYADTQELASGVSNMSRKGFAEMMDISVYSLLKVANQAKDILGGGSLITLSHFGAQRAMAGFNGMGIAKAALEGSVRYLAQDIGAHNIRVNAVSAGPLRTLSSFGIGNFATMKDAYSNRCPLNNEINQIDVAKSVAYLASDLSLCTTGEIIHVDNGYHSVGLEQVAPDAQEESAA
ncbi:MULTISPECIES: enoyl-ACP reductase FabI [Pseudoalteromonas]|uniref:Enoyl-[acyl-carrier-protein] reductase [NADH] n=1 Tax=Pseudoalteromonas amylolytica TaxID=1859457 RepID=A0A1S1MNG1_9GAMM|nr:MULTISPECIES: SDR family oxidoreductase [Pseudoalteromonas]MCF6436497.1 SDR family oxidoreductase [Pseudoalteromonas sp. MMG022]OHU86155.1 hypothetical protein BFC16_15710 [Pseudoalteromonas sp. JW3]OHU89738.1 hypothetical protein BET10_16605 [Pseudoalteromonas amylolytica]